MKLKKLLSLALAVVMVCAVSTTAWAEESVEPSLVDKDNTINLMDVYEHPDKYPDTEVIVYKDVNEYISALAQDENLPPETRDALTLDAVVTARNSPRYTDYMKIRQTVEVTSSYSAYPYFYILFEYSGSVSPDRMLEVKNVGLDRKHGNISKNFEGSFYYNLEDDTSLYWDLNGDFYDNGRTDFSVGPTIGLGEYASISFTISKALDHYAYVQEDRTYTI